MDGGTGVDDLLLSVVPLGVSIDIKPWSDPNSIALNARGDAKIAVAIHTTADFDAAQVDPATVTLGDGSGAETAVATRQNGKLFASLEDVDRDGDVDLVLHFDRPALVGSGDLTSSSTELVLSGVLQDGCARIGGRDAVRVLS